ncbi:glycosyltransferase [Sphingobacterium sp. lm-10]|uniref:glycosyltransferase n=1 Tax=Sphingobacterium sp. lm-10 TaxID=2944904 RepID=UPI0020204F7C|nr:glycosyltransferase [Sphingobacterium sp. lm-10]MCL7988556.1 glycosyltransferase [Sphingobacterium sp. lm-10]
MEQLSPIILFAYNRPEHTQRALEALELNDGAADSILYVFADGAKNVGAEKAVQQVRDVIKREWAFKAVHVTERDRNWGLANNVMDGVGQVMKEHGRAIVLEDDVLFARHTLQYFNEALIRYEKEEQVMHIGGFMYELDRSSLEETFVTRYVASQAWATWSRAWRYFEPNIDQIIAQFNEDKIAAFTFDHTMNFWRTILQQQKGEVDSWAVRWYASVFLKDGLAIEPSQSLIENIGHDGSGVHSGINTMFETSIRSTPITYFPTDLVENPAGYAALRYFFKHRKGNLLQRLYRFAINKLR